jgi:hypothetical protein
MKWNLPRWNLAKIAEEHDSIEFAFPHDILYSFLTFRVFSLAPTLKKIEESKSASHQIHRGGHMLRDIYAF